MRVLLVEVARKLAPAWPVPVVAGQKSRRQVGWLGSVLLLAGPGIEVRLGVAVAPCVVGVEAPILGFHAVLFEDLLDVFVGGGQLALGRLLMMLGLLPALQILLSPF